MDTLLDIVCRTINNQDTDDRPKVCLTWAQSLDGRLSATSNAATMISCDQSMQMTHALRALHETILVGIGTLISDNPRLTCRMDSSTRESVERVSGQSQAYSNSDSHATNTHSYDPIPVILDSELRTPSHAHCLNTKPFSFSSRPFIFHHSVEHDGKVDQLHQVVRTVEVPLSETTNPARPFLDIRAILHELWSRGVKSVMVEGGASVLSSFLDTELWDIVIITIAPTLFRDGVTLNANEAHLGCNLTTFRNTTWIQLGSDVIFIGFPCRINQRKS